MIDSLSSHLDELELLTYLDGAAAEPIRGHVAQCLACRNRAQELARVQRQLTTTLYRVECPSPQEIGEYHLGVLSVGRMDAVRRHIGGCPHCTREVAQLQGFLADLAPELEPSLVEQAIARVRVVIARLVSGLEGGLAPGQPAPALVGVRGSGDEAVVYEADGLEISLQVEPDPEAPGRLQLFGLVMGAEGRAWQAHLWRNDQPVDAVPVDELGNLVFAGLEPGRYDIVVQGPGVEIHLRDLDLNP